MNGFSTEEDSHSGGHDQICCLIESNYRCGRQAGNASYSKRIQKTVLQRRLRLARDDSVRNQGFFQQFWGKAPGKNWEKMIDLTSKWVKLTTGSKIYPQYQVILCCIMSSIPLKHKCLSIILIWVIVSHK